MDNIKKIFSRIMYSCVWTSLKIIIVNMTVKYNQPILGKQNLSLHTVIAYLHQYQNKSICSFYENLRHDPLAIYGHLEPIIEDVKSFVPNLHTVHFLSDGPST